MLLYERLGWDRSISFTNKKPGWDPGRGVDRWWYCAAIVYFIFIEAIDFGCELKLIYDQKCNNSWHYYFNKMGSCDCTLSHSYQACIRYQARKIICIYTIYVYMVDIENIKKQMKKKKMVSGLNTNSFETGVHLYSQVYVLCVVW